MGLSIEKPLTLRAAQNRSRQKHGLESIARDRSHGVELHCANGYLVSPFICAHTNRRDNKHGGSLQNRLRLLNDPRACAQMMYRAGAI
ncbi:hypothetical protein PSUM_29045 [Pseudomonas umsongensis]|uniref:NADH:flavin oxidoreductase/NADH oxidase N-terminal domain-containing protein n=1 Tax=Pseudomonas umsongensis TaxID=198618 RepID=A0ABX4DMZ1_9PSED|nr:hypothetical protein [Pseudomonas umsongensis]OXR28115.1 hypothetical protein PSUM_29045 [Pseudomonas umsongensis]